MLHNEIKLADFISPKMRKAIFVISLAGIAGCLAVLISPVRSAIIDFAEVYLVHRKLTAFIWHRRMILWASEGIVVFIIILARKFTVSFIASNIKQIMYVLIGIIVCFVFLPLIVFGDNSIVTVHDYLDQNLPQFKMFRDNGLFFKFDTPTKGFNEMSTLNYFYVGFNFHTLLYFIFTDFAAYTLNYYFSVLLGWFSMHLLLKKLCSLPKVLMLLISLCYAILPVVPIWNTATASLPLIIYVFFDFELKKRFSYKTLLLLCFPFFSDFPSFGIFILGFWFIGIIVSTVKCKKLNLNLLIGFILLIVGYVSVNLRMFYVMFILKTPLNRSVSVRTDTDELVSMVRIFVKYFIDYTINGYYHAASMQRQIILPVAFFISLSEGIAFIYRTAKTNGTLLTRIKTAISKFDRQVKLLYAFEFLAIIFACISGLYASGFLDEFVRKHVRLLAGFNWSRFWIFNRILWYLIFALCLYIILQINYIPLIIKKRQVQIIIPNVVIKTIVAILICIQSVSILLKPTIYNDQAKTWFNEIFIKHGIAKKIFPEKDYNDFISYREFFAEELFSSIKKDISYSDEKVVAVGYHPSVLMYNGFNCIDGYNNAYPLAYMQKFRTLIAPELEINKRARDYYDSWGGRMYLYFGGTTNGSEPVRNINSTPIDINIDMNVFINDFNGTYILSRIEIANISDLGLNFINQYSDEKSIYTVYLYKTKRASEKQK